MLYVCSYCTSALDVSVSYLFRYALFLPPNFIFLCPPLFLYPFPCLLFPLLLCQFSALFILQFSLLYFSDRGFLIRLETSKDSDRGKEKDKDKEKDKEREKDKYMDTSNPSVSYSHSALPVSSEAISLFRFLLRTDDWKALVEQTLLRPILDMTDRIRTFQVRTYAFHHFTCLSS